MGGGQILSFCWLSSRSLPRACDLRQLGWRLIDSSQGEAGEQPVLLAERHTARLPTLDRTVVVDVADPHACALLLARGAGDVVGPGITRAELAIRAHRVLVRIDHLPRIRRVGPLALDLLRRDGVVEGRALAFHPREFAMLWHLAALDGRSASRADLLREVWGIRHEPETNSVAVHAFRIRASLAAHGLAPMLATDRAGRYRLIALDDPAILGDNALDLAPEEPARARTVPRTVL